MSYEMPDVHAFTLTQADRDRTRQAAVRAACADVVRRHAGEHAPLILEVLGLDEPDRPAEPAVQPGVPSGTKRCRRCDQVKPVGEFYADRRKGDGRASHCKACKDRAIAQSKQGRGVR